MKRRFGLADVLGLVGSLVALAWLPGSSDPLTYPKLLLLGAGGLVIAPLAILRFRALRSGPKWTLVPLVGGAGLVLWGAISAVGSGAPIWNSLLGWWGRGDGWLAWTGAFFLLLGASTLSSREVARTVTWLLAGATVAAIIGLGQLAGMDFPSGSGGSVTATMGNTNFAAGYFAILGCLALGRALTKAVWWQRAWGVGLFLVLGMLAWETGAVQGPAALAVGVVALGVTFSLMYRGTHRVWGLLASAAAIAAGTLALVGSFFRVGPIGELWSERTFDIRQQYWESAMNIMNGLPVFGTGPDGFARYVAEFRPDSYVELLGPTLRVSAAHNVALQFGASLGYLGLVLWLILFVGSGLVLLARIIRAPVSSIGLTASVAGAFTAYFVQGMVSIDMLPLLATGWLVAGLALALAREPIDIAGDPLDDAPNRRKAKAAAATSRVVPKINEPSTPIWVPVIGGVLGLGAAILVGIQIGAANQVAQLNSQDAALSFITSPMTPCPLRVQVTQQVIQQLPADVSTPATVDATNVDRRCPPMIQFASDVLTQQQRFEEAAAFTADGVAFDPLLDLAWILRARYFFGVGDIRSAEAAIEEASRVQALYPDGTADPALIEGLYRDLAIAKQGQ